MAGGLGTPTKETSLTRIGPFGLRFNPSGSNLGIVRSYNLQQDMSDTDGFVYFSFDCYLASYTSGICGILVDLYYDKGTTVNRTACTITKTTSVTASNSAIANLAVSTLKIQDNAVTVPVSASASAQYNLYSTYADILSATITSSGQPIYVLGHAVFYASSSSTSSQAWVEIEVYRNGTFVWRAGKDRCSVVHWGDDHDIIREGTLVPGSPLCGHQRRRPALSLPKPLERARP